MDLEREADFLLMHFETPDGESRPIAALLLDVRADRLYVRARNCSSVAEPEDARVLDMTLFELAADVQQQPGGAILARLEDTLSNSVRLTGRTRLRIADFEATLNELYAQRVEPIQKFV